MSRVCRCGTALARDNSSRLCSAWAVRAHAHRSAAGVLLKLGHDGLAYIAAARSLEAARRSRRHRLERTRCRSRILSNRHVDEARRTATSAATELESFERTDERLSVFGSLLLRAAVAAAEAATVTGRTGADQ